MKPRVEVIVCIHDVLAFFAELKITLHTQSNETHKSFEIDVLLVHLDQMQEYWHVAFQLVNLKLPIFVILNLNGLNHNILCTYISKKWTIYKFFRQECL